MKFLIEIIGSLIIGALAAILLHFVGADFTATQTAITVGGILVISSIVHGITGAINKQMDTNKSTNQVNDQEAKWKTKRAIICIVVAFVVGVLLGGLNQFTGVFDDSNAVLIIMVPAAIFVTYGIMEAASKKKDDK